MGRCEKPAVEGSWCCAEHSKEKCQVCGEQALTRCQASVGVMCGISLCTQCGEGQMCLYHATRGPLMAIAALIGRGPLVSIFATREILTKEAKNMKAIKARLESGPFKDGFTGTGSMVDFDNAVKNWEAETK